MSTQNTELGRRLKKAIDYVAQKKGEQWAKETKAEFRASERFLTSINDSLATSGEDASLGSLSGHYIDPNIIELEDTSSSFFPGKQRITPHDTGNLIEAISISYAKSGNDYEFSVGVDYNKLNRNRYLYSWLFNRHGRPGVYVKRPGKNTSGRYVEAADRNSDEKPNFLYTWNERGKANVERIFR